MNKLIKGKRASEQQKIYLVDFLQANIDLAHDRFTSVDGAQSRENAWNRLAVELNAIGGANKDATKWRKFWMDQKLYAKDRHAQLQAALNKSGINGTKKLKPLSDLEERILAIMTPQAVDGDVEVIELGAVLDFDTNEPYLSISPVPLQITLTTDHHQPSNTTNNPSTSNFNFATATTLPSADPQPNQNKPSSAYSQTPATTREQFSSEPTSSHAPATRPSARRARKRRSTNNDDENYDKLLKVEEKKIDLELIRINLEKEKIEILKDIANSLKEIKNKI